MVSAAAKYIKELLEICFLVLSYVCPGAVLPFLFFFEKRQGKPPKKQGFFFPAEPPNFWKIKGKRTKKQGGIPRRGTKTRNFKKKTRKGRKELKKKQMERKDRDLKITLAERILRLLVFKLPDFGRILPLQGMTYRFCKSTVPGVPPRPSPGPQEFPKIVQKKPTRYHPRGRSW